jgi:hypothetical protein
MRGAVNAYLDIHKDNIRTRVCGRGCFDQIIKRLLAVPYSTDIEMQLLDGL